MNDSVDSFTDAAEFGDVASYAWWRDSHPDGFVLALRARHPPLLHRSACRDVDPDRHPGRFTAKGRRHLCSERKSVLREWLIRELPDENSLLARCPKCEP